MNENILAFSAMLYGKPVRLTVELSQLDIVDRDNDQDYDAMAVAQDLCEIEYEDCYEI